MSSSTDPQRAAARTPSGRAADHRPVGRLTGTAIVVVGLSTLLLGVWAFMAPVGFAATLAPWADDGPHFVRDSGAFKIAIGLFALLVVLWRDAVGVMLAGLTAGTLLHALSHAIDGDWAATVPIGAMGLLAAAALLAHVRRRTPAV